MKSLSRAIPFFQVLTPPHYLCSTICVLWRLSSVFMVALHNSVTWEVCGSLGAAQTLLNAAFSLVSFWRTKTFSELPSGLFSVLLARIVFICSFLTPLFWELFALKRVNRIRVWLARKKMEMAVRLETNGTCHTGLFSTFKMKVCVVDLQFITIFYPQYFINIFIWLRNPLSTEHMSEWVLRGVGKQQGCQATFWSQHSVRFTTVAAQPAGTGLHQCFQLHNQPVTMAMVWTKTWG